jgi:hypothetical protein
MLLFCREGHLVPERPGLQVPAQVVADEEAQETQALAPLPRGKAQAAQFLRGEVLGQAQELPGAGIEGDLGSGCAPGAGAAQDSPPGEADQDRGLRLLTADLTMVQAQAIAPQL